MQTHVKRALICTASVIANCLAFDFNFVRFSAYKCGSTQHTDEQMSKVLVLLVLVRLALAANFTCFSGDLVGDDGEICDGKSDCADSSDERRELCAPIICRVDQFKCYYGACISRARVCDASEDCVDGSDEFNCGRANTSCE